MKADQCIRGDLEVARTDRKGLLGATIPVGSTMGMTYDEFVKFLDHVFIDSSLILILMRNVSTIQQ